MAGLPMSPLTISAAVDYKTTTGAGRKLGGAVTTFGRRAIIAYLGVRGGTFFLAIDLCRHGACRKRRKKISTNTSELQSA
jgi:hypothetical protein